MKKIISYLLLSILFISCASKQSNKINRDDFADLFNIKNTPAAAKDWSSFIFSDQGAWTGYALPSPEDSAMFGSFTGPFLMTHGRWISQSIQKLGLIINDIDFDPALINNYSAEYLPGLLKQSFTYKNLAVNTELIFASRLSALTKLEIKNNSESDIDLGIQYSGSAFDLPVEITNESGSPKFSINNTSKSLSVIFSEDGTVDIDQKNKSYNFTSNNYSLGRGQDVTFYTTTTFIQYPEKDIPDFSLVTKADELFKQNKERWDNYLTKTLNAQSKWNTPEYETIAVKSIITLMGNWRTANGDILHDGLFPSFAINYFNGFWAWDSWKHSAGLINIDPELAKNQIRAMFDYQDQYGMIADCIYEHKKENNWLNTKPPLAAWAIYTIFEKTGDLDFVKEMYPKLNKYHQWWYKYRDHDQNGICEFGGTIDKLYAAGWESGMDNAVRFDNRAMIKNAENAYSMNLESVDLNAYLAFEKLILARFARLLNDYQYATDLKKEAADIKDFINAKMFDDINGYYYDIDLETKDMVKIEGPEGWTPLWTGMATQKNAARVKEIMMNEKKFNTFIPLPTLTADHPKFTTNGYWRGAIWVDQVYFGIAGLNKYGFNKEADTLTKKLFDNLPGLKNGQATIRENYDPLTGEGLEANHFSWAAAHLLMLYTEQYYNDIEGNIQ